MNAKTIRIAFLLGVCCCASDFVQATVMVFQEDFDGYTSFPDDFPTNDPINFGVPIIAEGADNDWYGARFETPDSQVSSDPIEDIYLDLGVQKIPGGGRPQPDPVGRAADDAGLLFKISTTGLDNVNLMFDWRLFDTGTTDRIVVGFTTIDLDPFFSAFIDNPLTVSSGIATPGGGNANMIADFFNDPAAGNGNQTQAVSWWTTNWTELLRDNNTQWMTENFALPSDTPEIWVAFWVDNGDADFAKIDNITVTAEVIPEPSGLALAFIGLVILASCVRRNRRSSRK